MLILGLFEADDLLLAIMKLWQNCPPVNEYSEYFEDAQLFLFYMILAAFKFMFFSGNDLGFLFSILCSFLLGILTCGPMEVD